MSEVKSRSYNVVLVEDDVDLCDGWGDLFEVFGHTLHSYLNGTDLLADRVRVGDSDILITDYYLPDLNGVDLVKKVRETRGELPCIILTGSKEASVEGAIRAIPNCRLIHKPVNIDVLESTIAELCEGVKESD